MRGTSRKMKPTVMASRTILLDCPLRKSLSLVSVFLLLLLPLPLPLPPLNTFAPAPVPIPTIIMASPPSELARRVRAAFHQTLVPYPRLTKLSALAEFSSGPWFSPRTSAAAYHDAWMHLMEFIWPAPHFVVSISRVWVEDLAEPGGAGEVRVRDLLMIDVV